MGSVAGFGMVAAEVTPDLLSRMRAEFEGTRIVHRLGWLVERARRAAPLLSWSIQHTELTRPYFGGLDPLTLQRTIGSKLRHRLPAATTQIRVAVEHGAMSPSLFIVRLAVFRAVES